MEDEKKSPTEQKTVEVKKPKIIKPKLTPVYDLLESAIKTWWKNLTKFIKIYLWGALFALIPGAIMVVLVLLAKSSFGASPFVLIPLVLLSGVCFLAALYLIIRAYIGIFLLVKNDYQGNELEIFKGTKKYFWSYLWLSILTTIFVLLWTCLLIVPGIIYSVFYSFAVYAFFFEDLKGMQAIKRSISLVKNYWWPVFGRFIVIGALLWALMMILSIPVYFIDQNSIFASFWGAVIQIVSFLIGPISLLYFYQIYKDLVAIKK